MRFLLAIAVSLSFLAGQACGDGVGFYLPSQPKAEGELMSRLDSRCRVQMDNASVAEKGAQADCGPGQCVVQGKEDPPSAALADVRIDGSLPDAPATMYAAPVELIAFAFNTDATPRIARPVSQVRRE